MPSLLFNGDKPALSKDLDMFEIAGLLTSNFSATEFRCNDWWAIILMISLRVGSAIAWKTSLLIV